MRKLFCYFHGGSANHGCEAIIRGTMAALEKPAEATLFSFNLPTDQKYALDKIVTLKQLGPVIPGQQNWKDCVKRFIPSGLLRWKRKVWNKQKASSVSLEDYRDLFNQETDGLYLSVGGDIYCYPSRVVLMEMNKQLRQQQKEMVLWGASIEPQDIALLKEDLSGYRKIFARESLTYQALVVHGLQEKTVLTADPAFLMPSTVPHNLPREFVCGNTIGINLSPMVLDLQKKNNILYKNIVCLLEYILQETSLHIAFIPHVVAPLGDDRLAMEKIYQKFKHTNRVCLISDQYNATELKGIISQCRFLIAARTHASIAAYSMQVPTLVIGYSVKARGIARDIFGTEEGYVLPVQELREEKEIASAFMHLMQEEAKIRSHYKEFMPGYMAQCKTAAAQLAGMLGQ